MTQVIIPTFLYYIIIITNYTYIHIYIFYYLFHYLIHSQHTVIQSHSPPQKKNLLSVPSTLSTLNPCRTSFDPGTTSFQMRMRIRNDVDLGYLVRWDPLANFHGKRPWHQKHRRLWSSPNMLCLFFLWPATVGSLVELPSSTARFNHIHRVVDYIATLQQFSYDLWLVEEGPPFTKWSQKTLISGVKYLHL